MSMPEAPIDEYSNLSAWKYKIGFPKNRVVSTPAYKFVFAENGSQYLFR
jgi:hypothetical protein